MACELIPWQSYIAGAVLEPVDCAPFYDQMTCEEERKRLNTFYHPTGGRRKLKKIATCDKMSLDSRALYFSETVNLLAIFGRPNVDLNINCPGVVDIRAYKALKRNCKGQWAEHSVENAVARTVLQTAMTITHQIDLLSTQYQWSRRSPESLPEMPREPYVWANWSAGRMVAPRVAVFTFPPWVFQYGDLSAFVSADMFHDAHPFEYGRNKWSLPQMLWAMIYDFCMYYDIHHFVLTTYEKWVFGLFTKSYQTAYARPAMDYDARGPTVLQTLLLWMDAATQDQPRV